MSRKASRAAVVAACLGAAALAACGKSGSVSGPGVGISQLALQPIVTGLDFPLFLTSPPGDFARLFVVQKGGLIRIVKSGALLTAPFLDVSALVSGGHEQGLLGLAFDPQYAINGRFYICYTDLGGVTHIVRYHVSAVADVADPTSAEPILTIDEQSDELHNGGGLAFGKDGDLYIGIGDGNGTTIDAAGNGQDRTDLLGSLLRIDVRGASGYIVPADNPYSSPSRPEIWNYGLRNPWRWSFDRSTGDLYIGDVGEANREEIDVAPATLGMGKGANYGWSALEGSVCVNSSNCDSSGFTRPVLQYSHDGADCAVIGGYVYRGSAIPALAGTYFYGDHCAHWVHSLRFANGQATSLTNWPGLDPGQEISSFGEDAHGELYVLTELGGVFKVVSH